MVFSLKFDFPQVSVIFSIRSKNLEYKKILFPVDKKFVFTSWNEELAEKYVPVEEETTSTGKRFLTNLSFRLVKTNFLSSRNSIVLFRALLKILKFGGSKLFKRNLFSARGNLFFG